MFVEIHESFATGVKVSSAWQMIDNGEQISITAPGEWRRCENKSIA